MDIGWQPSKMCLLALAILCLSVAACVPPEQGWTMARPQQSQATASLPPGATPTRPAATVAVPTRTPAANPRTPVPTSAPVRAAGELHLAVREDIKTLNPYLVANAGEEFVASLLYDTLLGSDSHGGLVPNLAERWELASDGVALTFWLNPQARWHNGQRVTAEDVVFSFYLVRHEQFPGLARVGALVDRAEAMSPSEVRFTLFTSQGDSVRLLGTQFRIVPADVWEDLDDPLQYLNVDSPIGSGPFLFVKRVEGEQLVLRNARTHHDMDSGVDTLVVEILRNEDRALEALKDGELDALGWDIAPAVAQDVRDSPDSYSGVKVAEAPGLSTHTLLLNLRRAPYDNPAFRLALAQALDTQALVDVVLMGFGDVATAGLYPAASPWQNPQITPIALDPQQAVERLQAAGFLDTDGDGLREHPDGSALQIPIACTDLPIPLHAAELVAASWEAVGIAAQISTVAQDQVVPTLVEARFDVMVHDISLNDPEMAFFYFHSSRGLLNSGHVSGLNYGGYANLEYDEIASASQKELDPVGRQELLYQLQEMLATDLPQIPLYHPRVLNLYRDDHFAGWSAEPGIGLLNRTTMMNLTVSTDQRRPSNRR